MANDKLWVGWAVLAVMWLPPLFHVCLSQKTKAKEKLGWIVLTLGGGPFVWIAWWVLAPVTGDEASD